MLTRKWFYLIFIIIISSAAAFAQEKSAWEFTVGTKGVYSSGISDANAYYKGFAGAGYDFDFLMISSEISRYFNYQTTDGMGSYDYINYNEAGLTLEIEPFNWLALNLDGRYSRGDNNYKGTAYSAGILFDFNVISFSTDGSRTVYQYDFDEINLNLQNDDYSFAVEYFFTESASLDAGFTYSKMIFEEDYDYIKYTGRVGTMFETFESLFIMTGVCAGKDSEEYTIYGFDSGFSWRIFDHVKILVLYAFQYCKAPDTEETSETSVSVTKAEGPGSGSNTSGSGNSDNYSSYAGSGGGINNPYLSTSKAGESYYSNMVSVSVSFVF